MASLIYPDKPNGWSFERAVVLSLALHALVLMLYLMLNKMPLPKIPDKFPIELLSVKMQASAQPATPVMETLAPVEPPKVTEPVTPQRPLVKTPRPVLAAQSNEASYQVPEQVAPTQVTPSPAIPVAQSVSHESAPQMASEQPHKEAQPVFAAQSPISAESEEITASENDAWGDYGEQLRALVNQSKQYPSIAIRRHLEGDATIVAQFVRGELVQVTLNESSSHGSLDEEAMRMVKKAIAQLGVKGSLKKKTFKITIPVSFKLE